MRMHAQYLLFNFQSGISALFRSATTTQLGSFADQGSSRAESHGSYKLLQLRFFLLLLVSLHASFFLFLGLSRSSTTVN